MKEVVIDARLLGPFGIGTYLKQLLLRFKDMSLRLRLIVSPEAAKSEKWLDDFDVILCNAPIYSLQEQLELPRLIPSCDLFFSPHFNVPLFAPRARKRLVTIHDAYHLLPSSSFKDVFSFLQRRYAGFFYRYAIKASHEIITVSEFSRSEICRLTKTSTDRLRVIYPGADHLSFLQEPALSEGFDLLKRSSVARPFFLFVGSSKSHKNLQNALKAFELAAKRTTKPISLILIGSFNKQSLPSNDRVIVLQGMQEECLSLFYRHALALIIPSFYEGFGLPAAEAMHFGCPVIASKAGSLPEVCGSAALYVDPLDDEKLSALLLQLLEEESLRKQLEEAGKMRSKLFSWEACASQHLRLIEEILE